MAASNTGGWTKGPLRAERRKTCSVVLQGRASQDGYSNRVAELPQWKPAPRHQPDGDEAYATALLFAAAPDLAEALAELHRETVAAAERAGTMWPLSGPAKALDDKCRAALSKAHGK